VLHRDAAASLDDGEIAIVAEQEPHVGQTDLQQRVGRTAGQPSPLDISQPSYTEPCSSVLAISVGAIASSCRPRRASPLLAATPVIGHVEPRSPEDDRRLRQDPVHLRVPIGTERKSGLFESLQSVKVLSTLQALILIERHDSIPWREPRIRPVMTG
jgi:hypothetical protein